MWIKVLTPWKYAGDDLGKNANSKKNPKTGSKALTPASSTNQTPTPRYPVSSKTRKPLSASKCSLKNPLTTPTHRATNSKNSKTCSTNNEKWSKNFEKTEFSPSKKSTSSGYKNSRTNPSKPPLRRINHDSKPKANASEKARKSLTPDRARRSEATWPRNRQVRTRSDTA